MVIVEQRQTAANIQIKPDELSN